MTAVEVGGEVKPTGVKTCRRCGEAKPLAEMKRDTRYSDSYSSFCRRCHASASVAWQKANPERVAEARRRRWANQSPETKAKRRARYNPERARSETLRRRFKMSQEEWEALLWKQGGACGICGVLPESSAPRFHVDHDHGCCAGLPTCGSCTRGLLCSPCNLSLGVLEKRGDWLVRAASYLEKHR